MTDDQQQKLSALLRLKRFEQPPPGYFNKLLQDVHRRQRAELLRRPLWQIAFDRFQTYFGEHSMGRMQYGGAMAAVLVTGLAAFNMSSPSKLGAGPSKKIASLPSTPPVVDIPSDPGLRAPLLSLQQVNEAPMAVSATFVEEPVANARLLREPSSPASGIFRQRRHIIDSRPASYKVEAVSFSF